MQSEVKKLFDYQITQGITEQEMCTEIGIDRRTLYNVRIDQHVSNRTIEKINNFIENKSL